MAAEDEVAGDPKQVEPSSDLFVIHDPEVDIDDIMAQIRRRVEERRKAYGHDRQVFPTFGVATCPSEPEDEDHDATLYQHLRLANETYAARETASSLTPSPSTRVPVLGRLWELVRSQAHSLVLFYVNRSITDQVNVDRHIISALNRLTAQMQEQQQEIEALRRELAERNVAQPRVEGR
jgi:hypothetical protein